MDPKDRSEVPENVRVAVQKDSLLVCYFGGSTLKKARPNRPPFRVAHPGSRSPVQPRASPTAARRSSGRQSCFRPSDNSRRPCLFTAAACPRACSGTSAGCAPASCTRLRCSGRRWRCVRAWNEHLREGAPPHRLAPLTHAVPARPHRPRRWRRSWRRGSRRRFRRRVLGGSPSSAQTLDAPLLTHAPVPRPPPGGGSHARTAAGRG